METAGECLVCGITETQQDEVNNVALLPVLAALLGQELESAPLITSASLCQRCCHLLSEAASLQQRLHQVKDAILSVYRPVQYHRSVSAPLPTVSRPLSVSTSPAMSASTASSAGQFSLERTHTVTAAEAAVVPEGTSSGAPGPAGLVSSSSDNTTAMTSVSCSTVAVADVRAEAGAGAVVAGAVVTSAAKRLPCPVCAKSVTARYLRAHLRQHSGERPFPCLLCSRSFAKSSDLSTHRRRHAGDRRHHCSLCPAAFFFPHELVRHKHRHGETRPHLCPECGAGFFSRAGLLRHQRVDHTAQEVDSPLAVDAQQQECGHCGKKFACERSLRRHERAHGAGKRYMCEECGVTYKTSTALRFHTKRQHSGERPYQCEICGRQFITRSVWLRHLRVHTGEAPFRCQFCATPYKDKQKLKRHYSNKHAAEVARVGVENLQYAAGAADPAATRMGEEGDSGQSIPATGETCDVSDLDPGRAMPDLDPGQAQTQVSDPGWPQQWKEAAVTQQAYGDTSAAAAHQGNSSAIQPQEMAPVEMMQDSAVLPQGMLYEAQSALFSYF